MPALIKTSSVYINTPSENEASNKKPNVQLVSQMSEMNLRITKLLNRLKSQVCPRRKGTATTCDGCSQRV